MEKYSMQMETKESWISYYYIRQWSLSFWPSLPGPGAGGGRVAQKEGKRKGDMEMGWGPQKAAAGWRERSLGLGSRPGCFQVLCERGFECWDERRKRQGCSWDFQPRWLHMWRLKSEKSGEGIGLSWGIGLPSSWGSPGEQSPPWNFLDHPAPRELQSYYDPSCAWPRTMLHMAPGWVRFTAWPAWVSVYPSVKSEEV